MVDLFLLIIWIVQTHLKFSLCKALATNASLRNFALHHLNVITKPIAKLAIYIVEYKISNVPAYKACLLRCIYIIK